MSYFDLKLDEKKKIFTENLVSTNRGFNFYVDWRNVSKINFSCFDIELNAMNSLIGIEDSLFEQKFTKLLEKLPSAIKTFPLLFGLSKKEREQIWKGKEKLNILEDIDLDTNTLEFDFMYDGKLSKKEIKRYYELFCRIGLKNLFQNLLEKSVMDYVTGVLVGLDSNGRKNRGGKSFELACEPIIRKVCEEFGIELFVQKQFKFLKDKYEIDIDESIANRKADFILKKNDVILNIEANFYFDSGSKPEEIIDSYANRDYELSKNNIKFIYLTDGVKCWGNAGKHQLSKGFNSISYIINFFMLKEKYFEDIIMKEFNINV